MLHARELYCYTDQKNSNVESEEIALYKELFSSANILSDKAIKVEIEKNRLLAHEILKKNLSQSLKKKIQLAIENVLAQHYIKEFKTKHAPSKEAIESFYLDHKDSFRPIEHVDISTIMVASLKKADDIYTYLKKHPEDFEKLAKQENLDITTKNGGKYVNVPLSMFKPTIRQWIREHKVGDISPPLQVGNVFYIEKIEKKYRPSTAYKDLKPDIKKILENIYVQEKLQEHIKKIKSKK